MSWVFALRPFEPGRSDAADRGTTAGAISAIDVSVSVNERLHVVYRVTTRAELLCPPRAIAPARRDDLWRRTCAELFLGDPVGPGYLEFNFSPSGHWAAYAFDSSRRGQRLHRWPQDEAAGSSTSISNAMPRVTTRWATDPREGSRSVFELQVDLVWAALVRGDSAGRPTVRSLGLTFVAESGAGLEYWALAHAPVQPDFHHPDTFVGQLEVPACESRR